MSSLTTGQLTSVLLYSCGFLSAFFVVFGLGKRDGVICLGLLFVTAGDLLFARHLWLQRESGANVTFVTFYICCAAAALYALAHQLAQYRALGCSDDDCDDDELLQDEGDEKEEVTTNAEERGLIGSETARDTDVNGYAGATDRVGPRIVVRRRQK